jgi:hypothetical protein
MANRDAPFGLRPVRHLNGNPWNGAVRQYYVPSGDSTAIFIGDPVTITGNANSTEIQGCPVGSLSEVTRATVGDTPGTGTFIAGVVVGVAPVTADSLKYRAASTERILLVVDDPDVVFEIQNDAAVTVDGIVGFNAVLIATHAGSTVTGLSGIELDCSSDVPAADASNQLYVIGLAKKQDNSATEANAVWEVLINAHQMRTPNLGIA